MEEIVKFSWCFKSEAGKRSIREFFSDWIKDGFIMLDDIVYRTVTIGNTSYCHILVAHVSSTKANYDKFVRDFSHVSTILEGWV